MKRIAIESLRISNFKGVKDLTLAPGGADATIRGDNGTGKTTVADAVAWLLFNRDSHGKADFQLKPVDGDGQEIHNLETEVEGTLSVDCKPVTFRKRFQEKWVKKRGSVHPEFQGHTTDYFIDSVPAKLKEYSERIQDIIADSIFKVLSNPFEFAGLHWQERRRILMEICGDVTDEAVIEQDEALAGINDILSGFNIEDHRKKLVARRKDVNKEIQSIPVRISELSRLEPADKPDADKKAHLEKKLAELREKLATQSGNTEIAEKQTRIHEIEGEILQIKNAGQDVSLLKKPLQDALATLEMRQRRTKTSLADMAEMTSQAQARLERERVKVERLREQWHKFNARTFETEPNDPDKCKTCGQALPPHLIQDMQARFNAMKADLLKNTSLEGKEASAMVKHLEAQIAEAADKSDNLRKDLIEIETAIQTTARELDAINPTVDTIAIEKLTGKKNALLMEIDAIRSGASIRERDTKTEIQETESALAAIAEQEAAAKAFAGTQERIKELSDQEKTLSAEYERIEYELNLLDRFTVAKVNLLESSINGRFRLARFKLFKEQINGGIEECCEILCGGVPFGRGLNTGACINVGLDIINILAAHHGVSVPVFVDNAEAVTSLIETESQLIRLVVDPEAKTLTHDDSIKKTA